MSLDALNQEAPALAEALSTDPGASPPGDGRRAGIKPAPSPALSTDAQAAARPFLLQLEGDVGIEEIAGITSVGFETAKSRLRYARTKLRELLKEHA